MIRYRDICQVYMLLSLWAIVRCNFYLYSDRYDNFDITPLLENDRILTSYMKCFLDHGPCPPDARDFKKVIPEALQTQCGRCTSKQSQMIKNVIKTLISRHPEAWEELLEKYDQEGLYRDEFNKYLERN